MLKVWKDCVKNDPFRLNRQFMFVCEVITGPRAVAKVKDQEKSMTHQKQLRALLWPYWFNWFDVSIPNST